MRTYPALLCSCVVSILALCHGLPLRADTARNLIKLQAENISARIQRLQDEQPTLNHLIMDSPELLPELPSDKPIEGLTSVVETLSAFQRVLHSLPKGRVTQLRSDVSKLQSDLEERMSSLQCPRRKTSTEKTLEAFLKNNGEFHFTLSNVALGRLQKYTQKLTHNLDQLKTC